MRKIITDIDNCLVNFTKGVIDWFEAEHCQGFSKRIDTQRWPNRYSFLKALQEWKPDLKREDLPFEDKAFLVGLKPNWKYLSALLKFDVRNTVTFVTNRKKSTEAVTREWLNKFGFSTTSYSAHDLYFCNSKLTKADVIHLEGEIGAPLCKTLYIDDNPQDLIHAPNRVHTIRFSYHYNRPESVSWNGKYPHHILSMTEEGLAHFIMEL